MMETPRRDELDTKVNQVFAGKAVCKDLVRKVKVGANVPTSRSGAVVVVDPESRG